MVVRGWGVAKGEEVQGKGGGVLGEKLITKKQKKKRYSQNEQVNHKQQ